MIVSQAVLKPLTYFIQERKPAYHVSYQVMFIRQAVENVTRSMCEEVE